MVLKKTAKPARTPVGRKAVRGLKASGTTTAKKTTLKKATRKPTKSATSADAKIRDAAKPDPESSETLVAPARANPRTPQMDGARTIANKLLGDDTPRAPLSVLLERVSGAIEDELNQIENMVSGRPVPLRQHGQAERRARMLASLARTLREVMQLRAGEEKAQRDDDAVPRDINELRRELASRLERIVADTTADRSGAAE